MRAAETQATYTIPGALRKKRDRVLPALTTSEQNLVPEAQAASWSANRAATIFKMNRRRGPMAVSRHVAH